MSVLTLFLKVFHYKYKVFGIDAQTSQCEVERKNFKK